MKSNIDTAKKLLQEQKLSCVTIKNNSTFTSHESGIKKLFDWHIQNESFFENAVVADKVIGKSAASVLVFAGVDEIYAKVISEHAVKLLQEYNIKFSYNEKVEFIKNRAGTDMCPMEKICVELTTPKECFLALKNKIFS